MCTRVHKMYPQGYKNQYSECDINVTNRNSSSTFQRIFKDTKCQPGLAYQSAKSLGVICPTGGTFTGVNIYRQLHYTACIKALCLPVLFVRSVFSCVSAVKQYFYAPHFSTFRCKTVQAHSMAFNSIYRAFLGMGIV